MLPSILAKQLREGLSDYIKTTFPMTTPGFAGSLDRFLETSNAVFHDPYVSVRLPFRIAEDMEEDYFRSIHTSYTPYLHQQKAFERLTGEDGRSTLIATGTGSGKTECFLYPILEYCYRHRGEKGIKALIIYPMNALASDQAKRIAEQIHGSSELRGNVTAGMYVGGHESAPSRAMSATKIITDHETMLSSPPDILLTNYKMLDYLLVRPKDAQLWQDNKPETLKYVVVDELHTFDGAQGTDLACLLRRLKSRLYIQPGYLCCVGTSATMGDAGSAAGILQYAEAVFGERFETDAVVTEDRLTASEFLADYAATDFAFPSPADIRALTAAVAADDQEGLLTASVKAWFDESFDCDDIMTGEARLAIGERLRGHSFTRDLLYALENKYVQNKTVIEKLKLNYPLLDETKEAEILLDALYALISHARSEEQGKLRPFLTVQVQLWQRELARLLAKVSDTDITYALARDLNENQAKHYLPVVNCRDCGETGWVSLANERQNVTIHDLGTFYNLYFRNDSKVVMIYPRPETMPAGMTNAFFCPKCLQLGLAESNQHSCSSCGAPAIPVIIPIKQVEAERGRGFKCPHCQSSSGLAIIGLRSATAISVSISQAFASRFNDDKKTLAFSDNVQDAAHRAGFFNSRTWRPTLRSAIQHFVLDGGAGLDLDEFSQKFVEYWHEKLSNEQFVSRFAAPNLTWMRAFENMVKNEAFGTGQDEKNLMNNIEYRLRYEIMLEYGLQSRTGRTLEKSGCSTLSFNPEEITAVASIVYERAVNELGDHQKYSDALFMQIVIGMLAILRKNGAFNDKAFGMFAKEKGSSYFLTNKHEKWLPGQHRGNLPRFIYQPSEKAQKQISAFDTIERRYAPWIGKCFADDIQETIRYEDIAKIAFAELVKANITTLMPSPPEYKAWGLNKEKVFVSRKVVQYVCSSCGTSVSVSAENAEFWQAAPCVRAKCNGQLEVNDEAALDYFGKLYSNGDIVRIAAHDHTGLLARDDREQLERAFGRGGEEAKPWDTNVLSCTPTLEMGINIGDLSTVILCNIPPSQAQYQQRIGRAGRKDGNALTLAVASARPHDLYFYTDPLDMIAGSIEPPKIFLEAPAVLERQFLAYCMDSWIRKGIPENAIPKNIGTCLSNLAAENADKYPFNFLHYVKGNISGLIRTFVLMFPELGEGEKAAIESFAKGSGEAKSPLHMKVYEAFAAQKEQRDSLQENIKRLRNSIKELKSKPTDISYEEEIIELTKERDALAQVVAVITGKEVFNFLSDEGLLPNYAFPESGMILKAILFRKKEASDDEAAKKKNEKMVYEYSRSAAAAIREFAPLNSFYVDGRKLTVDQVDLTSAQVEKWRLCPNCSYAENAVTAKSVAACPRCGTPAWSDAGQVRSMLKVQMVYSRMEDEKSRISDDRDDRQTKFYCRQLLVEVNEDEDISLAFRMDNTEFSFGYEFVKKAIVREINFGESDITGEQLTVAGKEGVRTGFRVCKYCGKTQSERGKPEHSFTCKIRNATIGNDDPYEEFLFLYRELQTEALRILVPATTNDSSQERLESFRAAFMLGMKKYFGNVDHLQATISEVPVEEADCRKQYLVIYDSVPGGTGYLKQLMLKRHSLIDIFEKALAALEECGCKNDPQKDGCYHCLYVYRQSQNIGHISRTTAVRLLRQILGGKDNLSEIPKLASIPVNSLFDSELERRFIETLPQMGNENRNIEILTELVNNKKGYLLKINDAIWEIEPQVDLDESHDVSVQSRPDFVLWPIRTGGTHKPVAIFMDGFRFHKDRVADDTLKREAIKRSGRFRVWTLSWKDMQSAFGSQGDYATETLAPEKMSNGAKMYKPTVEKENASQLQPYKSSAMELLMNYLEEQDSERLFGIHAKAYAFSMLDTANFRNSASFAEWNLNISGIAEALGKNDVSFDFGNTFFGNWKPRATNSHFVAYSGVVADMQQRKMEAKAHVFALLGDSKDERTDKYEAEWNGFWQFANVMQFLDGFAAVSSEGMEQGVYSGLAASAATAVQSLEQTDTAWQDTISQIIDDSSLAFAEKCINLAIPEPSSVGYELVNENGEVVGEAEFAWEARRIAFLAPKQPENAFIEKGWKIIGLEDDLQETFSREDE
jgi:DEAD/DEAH box helicase domain-containing protein